MPASERVLNLKGSPVRDAFKHLHKVMGERYHYAVDCDFVIIRKYPRPQIVAFVDIKRPCERLTFTQVIMFNDLLARSPWRVYVVEFDAQGDLDAPDQHILRIYEYLGGDPYPDPPDYQLRPVVLHTDWRGYLQWEHQLRTGMQEANR